MAGQVSACDVPPDGGRDSTLKTAFEAGGAPGFRKDPRAGRADL
jgi:hypothetical protein